MNESQSSPKRYILPLILLAAIVGGLAWLTQFLPSWRGAREAVVDASDIPVVCRFAGTQAVWDANVPEYVREMEIGQSAHYDFPIDNPASVAGEIGLQDASCSCSGVQLAIVDEKLLDDLFERRKKDPAATLPDTASLTWATVDKDSKTLFPAGAKGVLRVNWQVRGSPGNNISLRLRVWVQPAGQPLLRRQADLLVVVTAVGPVRFQPNGAALGPIGSGQKKDAQFFVWSATRRNPALSFKLPGDDPLFEVKARPLSDQEREDLCKRLRETEKIFTRALAAWEVTATVHERQEKDGKTYYHHLGPFQKSVQMMVDEEPLEIASPYVSGSIRSAIDVGQVANQGKVNLDVLVPARGKQMRTPVWCDATVKLEYVSHEPSYLQVNLIPQPKESTARRSKWILEVTLPPDTLHGPFPGDAAIFLRVLDNPARLIRIPVVGA